MHQTGTKKMQVYSGGHNLVFVVVAIEHIESRVVVVTRNKSFLSDNAETQTQQLFLHSKSKVTSRQYCSHALVC